MSQLLCMPVKAQALTRQLRLVCTLRPSVHLRVVERIWTTTECACLSVQAGGGGARAGRAAAAGAACADAGL